MVLYALVPGPAAIGSVALFVLCFVHHHEMYGGGFATVPAYFNGHVRHAVTSALFTAG